MFPMSVELVFGLVFVAFSAALTIRSVLDIISAVISKRWPRTTGTVIDSDVQSSRDLDGDVSYRAAVTYCYTVEGRELVARRTCFGDHLELSWRTPAVRTVRRYPVGASVTVRYNPHDPEEAVLEPGLNRFVCGGAAVTAVVTALALWLLTSVQ
jgi:hypothetical protein